MEVRRPSDTTMTSSSLISTVALQSTSSTGLPHLSCSTAAFQIPISTSVTRAICSSLARRLSVSTLGSTTTCSAATGCPPPRVVSPSSTTAPTSVSSTMGRLHGCSLGPAWLLFAPSPHEHHQIIMSSGNISFVKDFFIVGFPGLQPGYYGAVAALLLFAYVCILVGNGIFIALFTREKCLHKPMYYIILNLVVSDLLFSTTTLPKIFARYWFQDGSISFTGCFMQMYFVHYFGSVNSVILAIMAFDRYVAICNPLRYPNIVIKLNISLSLAYLLPYCSGNIIIHCYCDHISIKSLACTNRALYKVPTFAFAMIVLLGPLAFIVFSYCVIIVVVLHISSTQGRLKSFSTCSPYDIRISSQIKRI
ncbi:olfactory receptor 52K1-like [Carassius gibelio]|uniref:olfactory receptor 52K1-like n=1 Tax=Carassius gibelio TaxID=101364 RepID=UPI002277418C|nr:olfactory receptor 52K1-like [Carassius gibelio]